MIEKSTRFLAVAAVLTASLFVMGVSTVSAESIVPFRGMYEGHDSEGDEHSGSFVDWGTYSVFEGIVEAHGTYQFVEQPATESGGYYTGEYTISDKQGNSLSFESQEVSWIEYGQGKYGIAQSEWKIVGGEGKFAGATGEGTDRVWFNLEDMSYKGIISGDIFLS